MNKTPQQMAQVESLKKIIHNFLANPQFQLDCRVIKAKFEPVFKQYGYRQHNTNGHNILICHASAIGDFIILTMFINQIRNKYPNSHITILCTKVVDSLLSYFKKTIDDIVTFEYRPVVTRKKLADFSINILDKIMVRKYDIAFIPDPRDVTLLSAYLSGAVEIYGRQHDYVMLKYDEALYTKRFDIQKNRAIENYMDLIGDTNELSWKYLIFDNSAKQENVTNVISIGIGGQLAWKHLDPNTWIDLIKSIASDNPNIIFQIITGKDMLDDALTIENSVRPFVRDIKNYAGKLTLYDSMIKIANSNLVISTDTCVVHMAAATSVPAIIIYSCHKYFTKDYWAVFSKAPSLKVMPSVIGNCNDCGKVEFNELQLGTCVKRISSSDLFNNYKKFVDQYQINSVKLN